MDLTEVKPFTDSVPGSARPVKAVLGPTNTGKTHYAIERLLAHRTGMIGLPLRLLAREVYETLVKRAGKGAVALVTGEERIVPDKARYWVATVEAMPTGMAFDCVAIDEIQTATHFDRGHVFTDRLLNARGIHETLLLGADTMAPVIRTLLPRAEIITRPRMSTLLYSGSKKITRQPRRTAIVAFSANEVYSIAELLRRQRGGAAVVLGALSPRTRNAQVELYQNGDVEFLVATDAIGMGLNLDINHVAFASDQKYDGKQWRHLTPAELGQIAGRAGRHQRDGTFGVTGGVESLDEELVERLESHAFDAVKVLQWRNNDLDFKSLDTLTRSLEAAPEHPSLTRVPIVADQRALNYLSRHDAADAARGEAQVKLAWLCCQIPDYRDISPAQHGDIITTVFRDLTGKGRIEEDWIAEQVRFCDNTVGEIDTLSNRIKQIRTWTFIANRKDWLEDPTYWREKTRDIEDRLSDALHEKLTQRFVDRRTSVLMRHLRDRHMTTPEINDKGEVSLEGHVIGAIEGFRFTLQKLDGEADSRQLRSAAGAAIAPEIRKRAERLADSPNDEFILTSDGCIRWRGDVVAELAEGEDVLAPRVVLLADESLSGPELERVQDRLNQWLRHSINTQLEQLVALKNPAELEGAARGVAFQLAEALGVLPRHAVANEVRGLDQDVRGKMRKLGVKFGAYHIYLPMMLKPAPRELALILYALKNGGVRQPGVAELPRIVLSGRTSIEVDPEIAPKLYEIAGFKLAGGRAVRVDILERLADIIRPLISYNPDNPANPEGIPAPEGAAEGNGFRVTVEMTSLLGCAGEEFNSILSSLGYRVQRTLIEETAEQPQEAAAEAKSGDGKTEEAKADDASAEQAPAEPAQETASDETVSAETAPAEPETATAEAQPETAAGDSAAAEEPASAAEEEDTGPKYDEVWYPARRDRGPKHRQRGKRGGQSAQGEAQGDRQGRGDKQARGQGNGHKAGPRKGKGGKPGGDGRGSGANRQRQNDRPRKERPVDPDSPFAALAALKERVSNSE